MSKLKLLLFLLPFMATLPGCIIDVDDDDGLFGCLRGEGPTVSQEFDLPTIRGIEMSIDADVFITQGNEQEIIVEGQANVLDEIDLDVDDGIWDIDISGCVRETGQLKVFITMADLRYLKISGSGDIISENIFITDDVELEISGSGNIDLGLEGDDIVSKVSGSGKVTLEGSADTIDFLISGSGDYRAFNLEASTAYIDIRGSGDAEVFVTDELNVKISGSGDVLYKGNPIINVDINGSGDVIDAN